mgnify:CR=1 FL=1
MKKTYIKPSSVCVAVTTAILAGSIGASNEDHEKKPEITFGAPPTTKTSSFHNFPDIAPIEEEED